MWVLGEDFVGGEGVRDFCLFDFLSCFFLKKNAYET